MKLFFLPCLFILLSVALSAQKKDTIKVATDTARVPKRSFEASLFENDDTLTRNDYLLSIEKVFQMLNKASALSQSVPAITINGSPYE